MAGLSFRPQQGLLQLETHSVPVHLYVCNQRPLLRAVPLRAYASESAPAAEIETSVPCPSLRIFSQSCTYFCWPREAPVTGYSQSGVLDCLRRRDTSGHGPAGTGIPDLASNARSRGNFWISHTSVVQCSEFGNGSVKTVFLMQGTIRGISSDDTCHPAPADPAMLSSAPPPHRPQREPRSPGRGAPAASHHLQMLYRNMLIKMQDMY